jgi:hypothetical protein
VPQDSNLGPQVWSFLMLGLSCFIPKLLTNSWRIKLFTAAVKGSRGCLKRLVGAVLGTLHLCESYQFCSDAYRSFHCCCFNLIALMCFWQVQALYINSNLTAVLGTLTFLFPIIYYGGPGKTRKKWNNIIIDQQQTLMKKPTTSLIIFRVQHKGWVTCFIFGTWSPACCINPVIFILWNFAFPFETWNDLMNWLPGFLSKIQDELWMKWN